MSATTADHGSDTLSLSAMRENVKAGATAANDLKGGLTVLSRLVLGLLFLVMSMPAATVTLFLRRRTGLLTVLIHAPFGLALLSLSATHPSGHLTSMLIPVWFLLVFWRSVAELCRGLHRMLVPDKAEHVHRYSLGEPRPRLHRLWYRVLGSRARSGVAVALMCEAPFLLLLGVACFVIDLLFSRAEGISPAGALLTAASLSVAGSCAVAVIRAAYGRQILLDREMDQRELAASLESGSAGFDVREPEGFVQIPH